MKKLYTALLVLSMMPIIAQDSTRVKSKRAQIVKKAKIKRAAMFMIVGGVSYYVGYLHGKEKRHFKKGRFGNKDYGGKP